MRKIHLLTAWALLALVGLVAAGCGGGGSKKGYAMSKDEYTAALNKICRDGNSQIKSLGIQTTIDSFKTKGDQVVKVTDDILGKAKALSPPDELKKPAQEFSDAVDHALSDFKDATSAAKSGDQSSFTTALAHVATDSAKSKAAGSEIGANDCA